MWAAIGIYTGGEDNAFYRRADGGLVASGGKELRVGDTCVLGDDTIHAVTNPTAEHAGAIHVYGGDLLGTPRSEWDPTPTRSAPTTPRRHPVLRGPEPHLLGRLSERSPSGQEDEAAAKLLAVRIGDGGNRDGPVEQTPRHDLRRVLRAEGVPGRRPVVPPDVEVA